MAVCLYECGEHGVFEHAQPMTAALPDLRRCPECGKKSPRRYTPPAAVLVKDGTGARKSG